VPERFLRARYYVRIGVDLLGRADHPVDLPERAEGGRVPGRGRAQLGIGDPAGSLGRLRRWGAEDGVPHHRQPRGVDHGLIVVERHHVRADEAVQGERLRSGIGAVLADDIDQVGGAG
jgi:hypothetical protein